MGGIFYPPPRVIAGSNITLNPASGILPAEIAASGGGSGATVIGHYDADGTTASYDLQNIPATFERIEIWMPFVANAAKASDTLIILCNNDTGANYQQQRFGAQNGATTAQLLAQASIRLSITGTVRAANILGRLGKYGAADYKAFSFNVAQGTSGSGGLESAIYAALWNNNTNALDRLTFSWLGGTNFHADSDIWVLGYDF